VAYEDLWVVTYFHPADLEQKTPHVVGPFPAVEPAMDFDRELRAAWPGDEEPDITVVQVESTEPLTDLTADHR
jgi:hypothetical protein